ncbi:GyrI-like domain-containing protein [Sphingorhabdus sp.]|uniref:GyrI-like domain-containing protein n=1 Tax=Sphingorhabdus sp. TaxID=1902408 RepID=UPI0032B72D21
MLAAPQIIQTTAQAAAVIQLTVPHGELMSALTAQGVEPIGAVFAHHLTMSPDVFDIELGMKVSKSVKAAERMKPDELPATKVARTIYSGPYEGLPSAWGEFDAWLKANGHEKAECLWERYSVGPQSTPDSADWRTELNRPLKNLPAGAMP